MIAVPPHPAQRHGPLKRVFDLPLLLELNPGTRTYTDLYRQWIDDLLSIVAVRESLGLDPMVLTQCEHSGEVITYPRLLSTWPEDAAGG